MLKELAVLLEKMCFFGSNQPVATKNQASCQGCFTKYTQTQRPDTYRHTHRHTHMDFDIYRYIHTHLLLDRWTDVTLLGIDKQDSAVTQH